MNQGRRRILDNAAFLISEEPRSEAERFETLERLELHVRAESTPKNRQPLAFCFASDLEAEPRTLSCNAGS